MLSNEEKKAIERIEDFLTTNIIISISSDETANAEELTAIISKNEYLSIEFIASMFLKQSKELEELKNNMKKFIRVDKIKSKIEELEKEQEKNRNDLYKAVEFLNFKEIDKITDRIVNNMNIRDTLYSLLEKGGFKK